MIFKLCGSRLLRRSALRDTDRVAEFCTCGAQLPPDARFCHKCGKPQFEPAATEEPAALDERASQVAPAPSFPQIALPDIGFQNPLVLRVGLLMASLSFLLSSLPLARFFWFFWLGAAGFFAVVLYRKRTGQPISVRNGARIGWITGVFGFAISTILFTLSMLLISGRPGGVTAALREQASAGGVPPDILEQVLSILLSPLGIAAILLVSFLLFIGLTAAGGALAAAVLRKD